LNGRSIMRTWILSVAVCGLVLTAAGAQDKKDDIVKELDAKGIKGSERGSVLKPTVLASMDDVTKLIKEEDVANRLKKDVDFTKSQLVLFTWGGSGGDKLAFDVKEKKVVFAFTPGLTRDFRLHTRLFAIPKDYTHEVVNARGR